MKKLLTKCRKQRGVTILETLVGLSIMGVVIGAVFQLYINQHKSYMTQYDISVIQQNARASIDMLTDHLRMAGYMLPGDLPAISASNTDPDTITINHSTAGCDTYLSEAMPMPSAELKCGTDISCFNNGDWIYIYEPDSGKGEWFEITEVQVGSSHLQHNKMPLSRIYGSNSLLLDMNQLKFYIDDQTEPEHPKLMIETFGNSPVVFAEDIIDLDFQYRMKNGMIVDEPVITANIREILIVVTGRSERPDIELAEREHSKDQPIGQSGSQDGYRIRTYRSSVYLRNIGS